MSQVATMSVGIGTDLTGLTSGVKQAVATVDSGTRQIQASADQAALAIGASISNAAKAATNVQGGTAAARAFLTSMNAEFKAASTANKIGLFQGALSPAEFASAGVKSAAEFNAAVTSELKSLSAANALTPEIEARLVAAYKRAGLESGSAFAVGIRSSTESTTNVMSILGRSVTNREGEFTRFGKEGAHAMLGVGFAVSQLATDTGSGMERATHAVETFAIAFGPQGLLVAGLAAGALALYDFWDKAEKQADDAAKKIALSLSTAINASNLTDSEKALRELYGGTLTSTDKDGRLVVNKRSAIDPRYAAGSLGDLQAQMQQNDAQILAATNARNVALVGGLTREHDKLQKEIAPLLDTYNAASQAILKGATELNQGGPNAPIKIAAPSNDKILKAQADAVKALFDRASHIQIPPVSGMDLGSVTRDLEQRFEQVYKDAFAGIPKEMLATGLLAPLRDAVDAAQVQMARIQIENAAAVANGGKGVDIDKAMADSRKIVADLAVSAKHAVDAMDLPGTPAQVLLEKKFILDQIKTLLDQIYGKSATSPVDHLASSLSILGTGLHGLADAATALGNSSAGQLLNSAGNLATNVGAFRSADNAAAQITAGAGIVGSGIAILATVFSGQTALQKETQQLMATNNQRLQDVAVKLSGFTSGGANVDRVAQFTRSVLPLSGSLGAFGLIAGLSGQMKLLGPELSQFGLTLPQVEQAAKDLGFSIENANGTINQTAFQAFASGIADATQAVFKFGSTMSDQQGLLDLTDKLSGKSSDQDALNRAVSLIRTVAPALLPGNVDTGSAAGRDAIRKQLQDDLSRAIAGTIPIADFGGFQNIGEFESALGAGADALNALDSAASSVTASLLNVPAGLKVDRARFMASLAAPLPPVVPGTDTFGAPLLPRPTSPIYPTSQGNTSVTVNVTLPPGTPREQMDALTQLVKQDVSRGGSSPFIVAIKQGLTKSAA